MDPHRRATQTRLLRLAHAVKCRRQRSPCRRQQLRREALPPCALLHRVQALGSESLNRLKGFRHKAGGTHGGREREELSLRVQDAGNGGAEVRLTFLPHGPPAAALIFRMRDVLPCPYLEYWLARQRACSQCPLFGVEKRRRCPISHGPWSVPTPALVARGVCITIWSVHCSTGCSLQQSSWSCIPTDNA